MPKEKLQAKIQSLRETVQASYKKPEPEKLEKFQTLLLGNDSALDYLHKRGLSDDTIRHFKLGFDSVKNAIAIPIFKRGELVNIKYRILSPTGAKYTQEKDAEVWLFNDEGVQRGMEKGGVLVVEGEFDCMSAWQAGFTNVVSPASGKDSYGIWLELLDAIPKVYISYDNDKPGRETAYKFAERVGLDKSYEVLYPHGIKDANEFFTQKTAEDYRELIKEARPFYKYQFKGLVDIIDDLRNGKKEYIHLEHLPDVDIGPDWLVVVSGRSNVGKTSYVMNWAADLVKKELGVLVLPFERGPQVVGTRYLQVQYNFAQGDFADLSSETWDTIIKESVEVPLFFSMPNKEEVTEVIKRAQRLFNVKVVIIDHLDYMIRHTNNKEAEIGNTLQDLKRLAEELKVVMVLVSHVRKIDSLGATKSKKPSIEDLKGSSSLYQDPECVVMLQSEIKGEIMVSVVKNKGKMSSKVYSFNEDTGKLLPLLRQELPAGHQKLVEDF